MTVRQPRLARLLDVRLIGLRLISRNLACATRAAADGAGMALRIDKLRSGINVREATGGYDVKAAATTRSALTAAGAQQAIRVAEAEAYRMRLAEEVVHKRAAANAIAQAVTKAIDVERQP